jgi:hypothetical protein
MSSSRIFNGKRVDERNEFLTLREGELSVDLCDLNIYVHDGHTPGGRKVGTGASGQNGVSITGALVNDAGHLILTRSDTTTIDAGKVVGPSGTGSNFLSTGTGTVVVGFGLQTNPDGTISVNSATIQSLLPILEINPQGQSTTQITNNLWVQGLISASSLTVTNAIIFGDGTIMTSTNDVNVQTIAVSNITGSTVTNETNEVGAIRFDTAGFTVTDIGGGEVKITAISSGGFATTSTLIKNGYTVALSNHGKLSLANPFPITFTAVFDGDHFHLGPGGFRSLTGPATTATVTFAVNNGQIETSIVPQVAPTPVGYQVNDYFNFTEADHGIPGYTLSILFDQINSYPNFPRIVVSPAPAVGSAPVLQFPDGTTQYTAGGVIQTSAAPVGNTSTLWYDTVGGRSYVYYDSGWVDASPMPVVDTTQLVNNGYSLSLDSAGVVNLPTFSGSPSIAIVQTASAGISLNANGSYFNFNQNGSLTFPDGGRVVLHPYGNSYIESVDYGITTSTSSLNIFAGPDQKITLRANFGGTEKFWTFGTDGSLTWPDTSVQTGASISIADLKAIITTCTNFTEFKNAILGL